MQLAGALRCFLDWSYQYALIASGAAVPLLSAALVGVGRLDQVVGSLDLAVLLVRRAILRACRPLEVLQEELVVLASVEWNHFAAGVDVPHCFVVALVLRASLTKKYWGSGGSLVPELAGVKHVFVDDAYGIFGILLAQLSGSLRRKAALQLGVSESTLGQLRQRVV